jgi:hypothetical protein
MVRSDGARLMARSMRACRTDARYTPLSLLMGPQDNHRPNAPEGPLRPPEIASGAGGGPPASAMTSPTTNASELCQPTRHHAETGQHNLVRRRRNGQTESAGGNEVDDQFKLGRLLDWNVSRLFPVHARCCTCSGLLLALRDWRCIGCIDVSF